MNIFVIGNGRDLAHGLLKKYGDFLEIKLVRGNYMDKYIYRNKNKLHSYGISKVELS
mgnify:CR=1 FL=1